MTDIAQVISDALKAEPLLALRHYEAGITSPRDADRLKHRFQITMDVIAAGRDIDDESRLVDLAVSYAKARPSDRKRLLAAAVDKLIGLGVVADPPNNGELQKRLLITIGDRLRRLVLSGTLQQQLVCKLAIQLGLPRAIAVPRSVREHLIRPMIDGLIDVLTLGAPTTRDAAIEGLGSLLHLTGNHNRLFPPVVRRPVERDPGETKAEYDDRVEVSEDYFDRLERRRLMVLVLAGDPASSAEYRRQLTWPIGQAVAALCERQPIPWEEIEDVLFEVPDLLRILPALARQAGPSRLPAHPVERLWDAAAFLSIPDEAPSSTRVAFARFQESLFRTIDAALDRFPAEHRDTFDEAIAGAVAAIPHTIAGEPALCNAQIRATVAIIRTAASFITRNDGATRTKAALAPLFGNLHVSTPWSNHGIAEGCYRALPELVYVAAHDDLTTPALNALFAELERRPRSDDLLETHRRLIANSCFRRILVSLTDAGYERHLTSASEESARSAERQVEAQVRTLLHAPTVANIRRICQGQHPELGAFGQSRDVAEIVLAGIAFESALLEKTEVMFQRWDELRTIERVLLTRVLAAELHAISRDAPEIARHSVLRAVYTGTLSVSMTDDEAMDLVWNVLSTLPAPAAATADVEVQRFVEYRGARGEARELPDYVLAKISADASRRIAGPIAREIDLSLRRDERDLAGTLHQVMLRGPHESIFDHLLPRIEKAEDRATVLLFRKHVAKVLHTKQMGDNFDMQHILDHVRDLRKDLRRKTSPTLRQLRRVLALFGELTCNSRFVWRALVAGKAMALAQTLDALASGERHRKPLLDKLRKPLAELCTDVAHYVTLPVNNFAARKEALQKAIDATVGIERTLTAHEGLQPPERTLLLALMQHLRDLFERTIRWYCDEPRRRAETSQEDFFWYFFCDPGKRDARIVALRNIVAGRLEDAQELLEDLAADAQLRHLEQQIGNEPPRFRGQREKFEEFFVQWRADELDVGALRERLSDRWPGWFRFLHSTVTNFWWTLGLIFVPCIFAAAVCRWGDENWAGTGFFIVTTVTLLVALVSLTPLVHRVARTFRLEKIDSAGPGYWFRSLLPQLGRVVAVPMALIVEFDHSYDFPLHGSSSALVLLIVLAFVTTFFVMRYEIVERDHQHDVGTLSPTQRTNVRRVVALAFAHAFTVAVLLSAIFSASHTHGKKEHYDKFLFILPREVKLDLTGLFAWAGPAGEHAVFRFYPTIILTWTALGLFFGVFLENFINGRRLRKATPEPAEG